MELVLNVALNVFFEVVKSVFGEAIDKVFEVVKKAQEIGDCVKLNSDTKTPDELKALVLDNYGVNICINDWLNDRGTAKFNFVLNEAKNIFADKNLPTRILSLIIEVVVSKFKK